MIAATSIVWGSVPTWALFVLALIVAWRVSKGGGGSAVSELSKANEILDKRHVNDVEKLREKDVEISTLRAQKDVAVAIEPAVTRIVDAISEHETRALGALADHETRATERHQSQLDAADRQLMVLSMIADRLGPDSSAERTEAA